MKISISDKERLLLLALAVCAVLLNSSATAEPLHDAVRRGDIAEAERLIVAGADLEAQDDAALTPLITAALAGHRDAVALLIRKGANPSGRDGNGFTALHAAAHAGYLEIVKLLWSIGVDINDQGNEQKITPLHAAAERDRREIADFLLRKGAAIDLKADDGKTPAFMATLKAHMSMLKLLRNHGADCGKIRSKKFRKVCVSGKP